MAKKTDAEIAVISSEFKKKEERVIAQTKKIEKGYITIAGDVKYLHDNAKEVIGKQSFYDYAMEKFGFSRGTVGNLMVVASIICDGNYQIKAEYKNFGLNQILELKRTLTDEEIDKAVVDGIVKSEMTVQDMRKNLEEKFNIEEKQEESNVVKFIFAGVADSEKKKMLQQIMILVNEGATKVTVVKGNGGKN